MTRWAFVSDIHGNRAALARVEAAAETLSVERYVCLGDVIGRGDAAGCVGWVAEHATYALVGNRDIDHLDSVSAPMQKVVRGWLREVVAGEFVASHGDRRLHRVLHSAAEGDGFVQALAYMAERGARVWLFGHTHRARVWRIGDGAITPLNQEVVEVHEGFRYVVNVGTTGLPLPGRGGPSFTLYDDVAGSIVLVPVVATGSSRANAIVAQDRIRGLEGQ